jgi:hypothetical protein
LYDGVVRQIKDQQEGYSISTKFSGSLFIIVASKHLASYLLPEHLIFGLKISMNLEFYTICVILIFKANCASLSKRLTECGRYAR